MRSINLFESFLEDYKRRDKDKTAETYRKLLSQFEKWLDDRGELGKFGQEDVLDFLKQKDWANSSKNVFLASLSSWADVELEKVQPAVTDEEKLETRRLKRIKKIQGYDTKGKEKEPLSLENIMDLRTIMKQDTKEVFWILLWFGLRVGELQKIREIGWEKKALTVSTLKRKEHERTLYFDEYTEKILRHVADRELFEIPYSTLYKKFRRAGDQIGVDLTPHICRHTFATRFSERTDPFTLAVMLGHSVGSTVEQQGGSKVTGDYVHPSQEKIRDLMLEDHYLKALEVKSA